MGLTESKTPLVEASRLEVVSARGQAVRVHECDWKAASGDFWVIAGGHGSGKSDFLATVAALQPAGSGSLRLFGEDVSTLNEHQMLAARLRIGFVFKSGGRMFADLTVAENIALPLRYHHDLADAEIVETAGSLLELTGLADLAGLKTREIGANWHPRVGLARALALKPEILFLDEPASGLEIRHRRWWVEMLARLHAGSVGDGGRAVTLVVAANDPDPWLDSGKQFALLQDQRFHVCTDGKELLRAGALFAEDDQRPVSTQKLQT